MKKNEKRMKEKGDLSVEGRKKLRFLSSLNTFQLSTFFRKPFPRRFFDFTVELTAENRNFPWRSDPYANGVAFDSCNHDLDVVADHDRFSHFA